MKTDAMAKLIKISPEEKIILSGEKNIDRNIYTSSRSFIVNSSKLLNDKFIDVRLHTRFTNFPAHKHDYMELMYVYNGSISHHFDKNVITFKQGDLLVLNRHITHSIEKAGLHDIGINFIISDNFLNTVWQELNNDNIFYNFISNHSKIDGQPDYLYFQVGEIYPIRNLLDNIIYSIIYRDAFDYAILSKAISLLFSYLSYYKNALINNGRDSSEKEKFKTSVMSYIKQNYKSASLSQLSEKLMLSEEYLCRNIKNVFGQTFKELLIAYRMSVAESLLNSTDMKTSDIISAIGYENKSYFYRIFKEEHGSTPFKWRQKK